MAILTPEQRQLINEAGTDPVRLEDPETHRTYVILTAEVYDGIRDRLDEAESLEEHEAWAKLTRKARAQWAAENPY